MGVRFFPKCCQSVQTIQTAAGDWMLDAAGSVRVSQVNTFGDYHMHFDLNTNQLSYAGTGSVTWNQAKRGAVMVCDVGEYHICKSFQYHPYLAGKSQVLEHTQFDMDIVNNAGYQKYAGYFEYDEADPLDTTSWDGFMLHADATNNKYYIKVYRDGTLLYNVEKASWNGNVSAFPADMQGFNVFQWDFLWLGGTRLRLGVVKNGVFVTLHTIYHAGTGAAGVFIGHPNKPVTFLIDNTGGAAQGTFTPTCAAVKTEGETSPTGVPLTAYGAIAGVSMASTGTYYVQQIIKLQTGRKQAIIVPDNISLVCTTNDTFRWGLWLNPTQSGGGALSFSNVPSSSVQNANGNGTRKIDPTTGINLFSGHQKTSTESIISQAVNTQRRIGVSASGTYDELVLAIAPITSNLVTISSINFTEFT